MPSRDINDCCELLQVVWIQAAKIYGEKYADMPQPFLTCTYRTNEEQKELYAKGRTMPGKIVTYIEQNGKHNKFPALAFDVAFKKQGALDWSPIHFRRLAKIISDISDSVEWGGNWRRFKDLPHFEIK